MSKLPSVKRRALARTLGIVKPHLREHTWLMSGGIVALLFEVIFRVLEPWPVKFVVDAVTRSLGAKFAGGGADASVTLLLACGAAVVTLVGLRALANYMATVAFALAGSRVATSLRARVFRHVQSLSDRYHGRANSGDTVQRLVGDVGKLQEVAVTAGLPLLANVITLVVMTAVMFWLDPLLALVVVVAFAAYLLLSRGSTGKITTAARKTRKGEGALASTAQESLGAIRVVQAYGLESVLAGRFSSSNHQALTEGVQARRLAAALERRTDVIVGVATAVVLVGGGMRVVDGAMSPGDLVIFLTYLKTAMKPMRDLAKYTGRIARAAAAGERVADLLDEPVDIADAPDARDLTAVRGDVVLEEVWAAHADRKPVLADVNVTIPAGQRVAVVGPSGAGKSTLAALLVRMMDPIHGTVRLDGVDLRDITVDSLRSNVSLLLQESVLFTGTIRENIRYGRLDATDEEVVAAARRAQAHDFIMGFEHGYDTLVGERGATMSGGQRQRLAIARALLRQAPVVVLDEATTGLDPKSSADVLAALGALSAGRTTITISHDAGPALAADRVLWIQDGRVLLDGAPDELLAEPDGIFGDWVRRRRATAEADSREDTHARP